MSPELLGSTFGAGGMLATASTALASPQVQPAMAVPTDLSMPIPTSSGYDFPSSKLGQLLGFKGLTIQKVKEVSGVTRLHIHDKEKAKMQPTVPVEVAGGPEQVAHCTRLLEAICSGDQTELGHLTTYVNIEPGVVGKCMGYKGTTVKQMTEVTGCYIEIQQDRSRGPSDTPRLFIAGQPEAVEYAVGLVNRFIASPGSKLDALLGGDAVSVPGTVAAGVAPAAVAQASAQLGGHQLGGQFGSQFGSQQPRGGQGQLGQLGSQLGSQLASGQLGSQLSQLASLGANLPPNIVEALQPLINALAGSVSNGGPPPTQEEIQQKLTVLLQGGSLGQQIEGGGSGEVVYEADGPKEERIIEVPARKKGHLLGLHGQTIEKIRQTSGVIKCHIMADRARSDKEGAIQVQIFGTRENVEACADLVMRVVGGDHTGIGHSSAYVAVENSKVNRLRGDHWQVINALKDLTNTYLDILQGPQAGFPAGEAQLFIAGPPESVERAKTIVTTLLNMMDHIPATGEVSPDALGSILSAILPGRAGAPVAAATPVAAAPVAAAPAPAPAAPNPSLGALSGALGALGSALGSLTAGAPVASLAPAPAPAPAPAFAPAPAARLDSTASGGAPDMGGLLQSLAQLGSTALRQQAGQATHQQQSGAAQQVIQLAGQYLEQLTGSRSILQGQGIDQLAQQAQAAVDSLLGQQAQPQQQPQQQYAAQPQYASQQPQHYAQHQHYAQPQQQAQYAQQPQYGQQYAQQDSQYGHQAFQPLV